MAMCCFGVVYICLLISLQNHLFSSMNTLYNTVHFRFLVKGFLSILLIAVQEKILVIHFRRLQATLGHLWFMHSFFQTWHYWWWLFSGSFFWHISPHFTTSFHPDEGGQILKPRNEPALGRPSSESYFICKIEQIYVKADLIKTAIQFYRDDLALKSPKMLHGKVCRAAVCSKLMCGMISFLQS